MTKYNTTMNITSEKIIVADLKPAISLRWVAISIMTLITLILFATSLPIISKTLVGTQPKDYWYLSRASSFVGFGLTVV